MSILVVFSQAEESCIELEISSDYPLLRFIKSQNGRINLKTAVEESTKNGYNYLAMHLSSSDTILVF